MANTHKEHASFFSHDCDMRNDVKIKALRQKFKLNGYAVWCLLLETLTDSPDFELSFTEMDRELIAADFGLSAKKLQEIVDYCIRLKLLILTDDEKLYSESHKARFSAMLEKRRKRSEAGRKGNEVRWSTKKEAVTTSSQCDKGAIANSSQSVATPSDSIAQNRIVEYSIVSDSIVENSRVNNNKIEKENSLKRKSSCFMAPDVKQVSQAIEEKGYHIDAEEFVAYFGRRF